MQQETAGEGTGARVRPASPDALELRLSATLEPTQASLRATKAKLRAAFAEWKVEERTANAAYDVAHELLTNALRHGVAPIEMSVHVSSDHVRLQVSDGSTEPARMLPYRPGVSERGIGLRLVQQLSAQWGQQLRAGGKTVWATFHRRPPHPPDDH